MKVEKIDSRQDITETENQNILIDTSNKPNTSKKSSFNPFYGSQAEQHGTLKSSGNLFQTKFDSVKESIQNTGYYNNTQEALNNLALYESTFTQGSKSGDSQSKENVLSNRFQTFQDLKPDSPPHKLVSIIKKNHLEVDSNYRTKKTPKILDSHISEQIEYDYHHMDSGIIGSQ